MASNLSGHKYYQKYAIVAALALVIAGSSFSHLPAANASSAAISAIPPVSDHDKGKYVHLKLSFVSDTGNAVQKIRVTVDDTPKAHVLEFLPDGTIFAGDSVFAKVTGHTSFVDDGGYGGHAKIKGQYQIRLLKAPLSVGKHPVALEVVLNGASSLTDNTSFTLTGEVKGPPPTPADIVTNFVVAEVSGNSEHGHKSTSQEIHAVALVSNFGGVATGKFDTTLYLSTDNKLDIPGDIKMTTKSVDSIAPGHFKVVEFEAKIPSSVHGSYYAIALADSGNKVVESNEANNSASTLVPVQIK